MLKQANQAKERARDWWVNMPASSRKGWIRGSAITGILIALYGVYLINQGGDDEKSKAPPPEAEEVTPADFMDRDVDARIKQQVQKEVERRLKELGIEEGAPETPPADDLGLLDGEPIEPNDYGNLDELDFGAEPPSYPPANYTPAPAPDPAAEQAQPKAAFIGGINNDTVYTPPAEEPPKRASGRIPIPPGFMPGKLLVGVHAEVSSAGSNSPKPIHIRVQAPATLPNNIKLQLAGCFVIANTWGNLGSERIEGETVSINCITQDRQTIVRGDLKGYLADAEDGARDLRGRVVTKMGALMGRQFIADLAGGFGNSLEQGVGSTSISPLGSVRDLDTDETLATGVASGASGAFNNASDYIGELISQSGPVIESGAAREVMIMVQDMSWMEVVHMDQGIEFGEGES